MCIKEKEGETRKTQRLHTTLLHTAYIFSLVTSDCEKEELIFFRWLHLIARKRRLYICIKEKEGVKEKDDETRKMQRLYTQHYCTLFIFFR